VTSTQAETIAGTGIGTFPCTISSSGLYHLTSNNAQFNRTNGAAILIQLSEAQKDRDVVLDLNDHTIAQTNRQYSNQYGNANYPTGIKIVTTGKGRVTIRNGTLVGFGVGIEIYGGDQFLIEDMTIVGPSRDGIWVSGRSANGTIRNNRIIGTTDTVPGFPYHCGINFSSSDCSGMRILNNDVQDLTGSSEYALGIDARGVDFIVENNRVHNIQSTYRSDYTFGIMVGGSGTTVINSRISGIYYGIYFVGGGHYRGNIVDVATSPYVDGTNAGNNH
jgi:hypothetical protein